MSALASDKQKHKVVMYYYDTVLSLILTNTAPYLENSLDLIGIIGKVISAHFKEKFPIVLLIS